MKISKIDGISYMYKGKKLEMRYNSVDLYSYFGTKIIFFKNALHYLDSLHWLVVLQKYATKSLGDRSTNKLSALLRSQRQVYSCRRAKSKYRQI